MSTPPKKSIEAAPDEANKKKILDDIKAEISRIRNYTPKVAVFGDTGVGKSSLCNALFGKEIAEIPTPFVAVVHFKVRKKETVWLGVFNPDCPLANF